MFNFTVYYNFYCSFTHIMQKSPKNSRSESSSLNVNTSHLPWFDPSQSFRFIAAFRPPDQNSLLEAALQESVISVPTTALLARLALGCDHCDLHGLLKSQFNAISPSYFSFPLHFFTGIKAAVITMETSWRIKKNNKSLQSHAKLVHCHPLGTGVREPPSTKQPCSV